MNSFLKKNKFFKRRLLALIILLILIMFFAKLIKGNRVSNYKTIFPTLTTFEKDIDTKIYNLFDEKTNKIISLNEIIIIGEELC